MKKMVIELVTSPTFKDKYVIYTRGFWGRRLYLHPEKLTLHEWDLDDLRLKDTRYEGDRWVRTKESAEASVAAYYQRQMDMRKCEERQKNERVVINDPKKWMALRNLQGKN